MKMNNLNDEQLKAKAQDIMTKYNIQLSTATHDNTQLYRLMYNNQELLITEDSRSVIAFIFGWHFGIMSEESKAKTTKVIH